MVTPRGQRSSSTTPRWIGKSLQRLPPPIVSVQIPCIMLTRRSSSSKFAGQNHIHFGDGVENYVTLPVIPSK